MEYVLQPNLLNSLPSGEEGNDDLLAMWDATRQSMYSLSLGRLLALAGGGITIEDEGVSVGSVPTLNLIGFTVTLDGDVIDVEAPALPANLIDGTGAAGLFAYFTDANTIASTSALEYFWDGAQIIVRPTANQSTRLGDSDHEFERINVFNVYHRSAGTPMRFDSLVTFGTNIEHFEWRRDGSAALMQLYGTGQLIVSGGLRLNNRTSGPGAGTGTLTNAPSAGDPDFWLPININGVAHWIPAWAA